MKVKDNGEDFMESKIIMPLKDGGIVDVKYDYSDNRGCETCDFGSSYIDDFTIEMTKIKIRIYLNTMYEHAISEGKLMRILLSSDKNMDELEFADWLYEKIYDDIKEQNLYVGGLNNKVGGVFTITDEANCMKRSTELTEAYLM